MSEESSAPKRVRLSNDEISSLSKEDLVTKCLELEMYVSDQEKKQADVFCAGDSSGALDEKWKQQQLESSRKEKVLVMRLTTKEQELQELAAELSKAQNPSTSQLRNSLLDPAINLLFQKMRKETEDSKTKLQQANDDMAAWKFTPDSQTGKRLMSKCRSLLLENQELGRQISSGKTAQLEAELALQKKYSEELKTSQDELNEFVIELDEEVEGMHSTICTLQQQLKDCKDELTQYKSQYTLPKPNGHGLLQSTASEHHQQKDADEYNPAAIKAEQYNAPVRTESGAFTVGAHTSSLSVELEAADTQDEGYRTTHATECASTGAPDDIADASAAVANEIKHDENQRLDFVEEQFLEDETMEDAEVKYGWEGEKGDSLTNSQEKELKADHAEEILVNDRTVREGKDTATEEQHIDADKFRTDSVDDVRIVADDHDNDTGNETPSYGELSDTEQTDNKITCSDQLLTCKFESTYKPNNILTVDPIQKSLPIVSDDDDDNTKGKRTESPVNGRALAQHTVALPLDSTKISLVDGYSSDDGGGSVELSTTKAASNFELNGLHKLSDGLEGECMDTD